MRFFTTIATLALAASVSAQSSSSTVQSVLPTSTSSAYLTPEQTCLAECAAADICCQAACVNVPCPNEAQINATTECAGQCVQGNGTLEETNAYASCQQSCISSYFLTSTGLANAVSTNAASATATGSSATTHTGSGSSSHSTASATGVSASASSTGNAAAETRAALTGAGLLGLLVVGLAL